MRRDSVKNHTEQIIMIRLATVDDLKDVCRIVVSSIEVVYPQYYPIGAVDLYLNYHNFDNIKNDITENKVYIICDNGLVIGTVTIFKNDISRLYVDPDYQKQGYGTLLLEFAEKMISENMTAQFLTVLCLRKVFILKEVIKKLIVILLKQTTAIFFVMTQWKNCCFN